jgi:hypothetical protein
MITKRRLPNDGSKMLQMELFTEFPEWFYTECLWVRSYWNRDTWYYQDVKGFSMSDDFGRHIHKGSMLPAPLFPEKKHFLPFFH